MTLKGVCNALLKKTQALDVILLFAPAADLLQPLCELLDNWQDTDDQGKQTPRARDSMTDVTDRRISPSL
jgi:mediator of RNA polymerase II transcription subunit 5